MKKIIFLAIMFVVFGCSDNSVSADPTEVSTNPVGTVTEPSDLTIPEETVTEPVTKSNPEETTPTYVSSLINTVEKRYTCDDDIDWTGFDFSDLIMSLNIGDWYPYGDVESIVSMEYSGHGYLSISKTRIELHYTDTEASIREAVTNLYIANGVDNPEQMENDIANLCKLLNWSFKLKVESEKNDGHVMCNPID